MPQDFSCTDIEFVRTKMSAMFKDAEYQREVQPEVDIVNGLVNMQTADLRPFDQREKKAKVKVYWVEACDGAVQDCTTDCDWSGENVSSACKDYEISQCKESNFTIDDSAFYDNYVGFQEAVAKGLLKHTTNLDNWINTQVISALDSFAGENLYTKGPGVVTPATTYIDAPFWTPSLMSYFAKVRKRNYIPMAKMFSGENFFDDYWNAQADQANANGKGALNKFDAFGWMFDITNFDDVLGDKKSLMVSPHSAAFVSTNRVLRTEEILNGADVIRFNVPSQNIPGVIYDVYYRTTCLNAGEDTVHHWRVVARMDVFQSPVICDNGNSGILSFTCGVQP